MATASINAMNFATYTPSKPSINNINYSGNAGKSVSLFSKLSATDAEPAFKVNPGVVEKPATSQPNERQEATNPLLRDKSNKDRFADTKEQLFAKDDESSSTAGAIADASEGDVAGSIASIGTFGSFTAAYAAVTSSDASYSSGESSGSADATAAA